MQTVKSTVSYPSVTMSMVKFIRRNCSHSKSKLMDKVPCPCYLAVPMGLLCLVYTFPKMIALEELVLTQQSHVQSLSQVGSFFSCPSVHTWHSRLLKLTPLTPGCWQFQRINSLFNSSLGILCLPLPIDNLSKLYLQKNVVCILTGILKCFSIQVINSTTLPDIKVWLLF